MALKRQDAINTITEGISWLESLCKVRGKIHLFDANTVAHELFRRLLNEMYDLNLVVLDRIHQNFPAIDLGDDEKKRSFQITTEKKGDKIQATIDAYNKHSLVDRYGKLQVIVIGDRQKTYDRLKIPAPMSFVWTDDIIDTNELIKHIEPFSIEKLERIAAIIKGEIKSAPGGITEPNGSPSPKVCLESRVEAFNLKSVDLDPPDAIMITLRGRFVVTNTSNVTARLWKMKAKIYLTMAI